MFFGGKLGLPAGICGNFLAGFIIIVIIAAKCRCSRQKGYKIYIPVREKLKKEIKIPIAAELRGIFNLQGSKVIDAEHRGIEPIKK